MVEFVDNSMLTQLSTPDIYLPIQYTLTYPKHASNTHIQTNLTKLNNLTFEEPNPKHFPTLQLARKTNEIDNTLPTMLNATNKVTVDTFINRHINFPQISEAVRRTMDKHEVVSHPTLDQILETNS